MISVRGIAVVLFIVLCAIAGEATRVVWLAVVAAQKAERGTQQWKIDVPGTLGVLVVDTAGVCLYIVPAPPAPAIAAVPKTQLPQGAGCQ